jgi:hypothetical protein
MVVSELMQPTFGADSTDMNNIQSLFIYILLCRKVLLLKREEKKEDH